MSEDELSAENDAEGDAEAPAATEDGDSVPADIADDAAVSEGTPPDPVAKLREQLLRTAADFDNFRKRTRRDIDDAERRGREETLREMLPVFDNLERAVAAAGTAADVASVAEGVQMVLKQFEDAAQRLGLERVPAVGQRFDPALHDAVQQIETTEHPPGTIVGEVVPGYRIGGKLVRAALVVVARPPAPPEG